MCAKNELKKKRNVASRDDVQTFHPPPAATAAGVINNVSRDGPRTLASGTIHQPRLARERSDNDSTRRGAIVLPERHVDRRISVRLATRRDSWARSFNARVIWRDFPDSARETR